MTSTITLKKNHDHRLKKGHLWIYSNEIEKTSGQLFMGAVVRVLNSKGEDLGLGFYNPNSLIAVRLLSADEISNPENFLAERFTVAKGYRENLFLTSTTYRFIFGESDFLPGLVIDRYGDYFSVQILSAGMELWMDQIVKSLRHIFPDTIGIVEKNKSKLRELEGLELREGIIWGKVPDQILMSENGIQYEISLLDGQKTGYFLDQKPNRQRVQELAAGKKVLDCFTNQGGFALNAAKGGAKHVLGIDISDRAIESCRKNANLNSLKNVLFQTADVFDFLKSESEKLSEWDMIILDPPSFTKSKKNVPSAKKGYAEINRLALKLLPQHGFLVTASCSHHIFEDTFLEIITQEAISAGRQLRLVFRGNQSPDHPILQSMPETQYLKFFIFEVI